MNENNNAKVRWWGILQNNSGGYFIVNDAVGHWVFVQAYDAKSAAEKLLDIT